MFDNDYKSAMDEIKPDGYIKQNRHSTFAVSCEHPHPEANEY